MSMPRAFGYGPFRRVMEGDALGRLTPQERCAVKLHELAHLYFGHPGQRLLRLLNPLNWSRLGLMARADEFEADAFVCEFGFGRGLDLFLQRLPQQDRSTAFHPAPAQRRAALHNHPDFPRLAVANGPIELSPYRTKEKHRV